MQWRYEKVYQEVPGERDETSKVWCRGNATFQDREGNARRPRCDGGTFSIQSGAAEETRGVPRLATPHGRRGRGRPDGHAAIVALYLYSLASKKQEMPGLVVPNSVAANAPNPNPTPKMIPGGCIGPCVKLPADASLELVPPGPVSPFGAVAWHAKVHAMPGCQTMEPQSSSPTC